VGVDGPSFLTGVAVLTSLTAFIIPSARARVTGSPVSVPLVSDPVPAQEFTPVTSIGSDWHASNGRSVGSERSIEVYVRQDGGRLVPDAVLTLIDPRGQQVSRGRGDSDGGLLIDAPEPGSYALIASARGHQPVAVTVTVGARAQRLELTLPSSGEVSGTVRRRGGAPVAGATVTLTTPRGEVAGAAVTGDDGEFACRGVPSGLYTVVAVAEHMRPFASVLTVPDSGVLRHYIDLEPAAMLVGAMRDALRRTGRHIVYSINPNSSLDSRAGLTYSWSGIADVVRNANDLIPVWHNPSPSISVNRFDPSAVLGLDAEFAAAERRTASGRSGYWNDPDMLVAGLSISEFLAAHAKAFPSVLSGFPKGSAAGDRVQRFGALLNPSPQVLTLLRGVPSLSPDEQRTHLSLWAMLAAPLTAGNDVRSMSAATAGLLTNRDMIAIDQDPLGTPAKPLAADPRILVKPLAGGSVAVALFNSGDRPASIRTTTAALGLAPGRTYTVHDVWAHTTTTSAGAIGAETVAPHATTLLRITPG
jgi:hypothetical protein